MLRHSFFNILYSLLLTLSLSACASIFFPDFEEGNDIVVDDGGKVEVRKVEEKGVLIGDKANALYEDDNEDKENAALSKDNEEEKVTPAKVTKVTKSEDLPQIKPLDSEVEAQNDSNPATPRMHYLAGVVYFANGGAYIDADGNKTLRKIASQAKKHNAEVEVCGFASSRTRNTDPVSHKLANFKISAARADNVAKALRSLGVKKDKIATQALSDSMPMYLEVMPEGERLNRRAEIYLTY